MWVSADTVRPGSSEFGQEPVSSIREGMVGVTSFGESPATRRSILKGGLLGGLAVVGTTLAFAPEAKAATAQDQWYWCHRCQGLFYGGFSTSRCPAGGQHDGSQSYDYVLADYAASSPSQSGWCWCNRCQGLFYGPGTTVSWCPAGGRHNANDGSYDYCLWFNQSADSGSQDGWRWCRRCQGLFYGPFTGNSICPASSSGHPTPHDGSQSYDYLLVHA